MLIKPVSIALSASIAMGIGAGCQNAPVGEKTQGAAIGGLAGAAAGAALAGKDNRLMGALIGGALGAGGGYLIGSQIKDSRGDKSNEDAVKASQHAQANPATAEQARRASTADVNGDGFVTMDEVVAMKGAGLSDSEILTRLEKTGMFFELTPQQEQYLRNNGVSDNIITRMQSLNPDARKRAEERAAGANVDTTPVGHK